MTVLDSLFDSLFDKAHKMIKNLPALLCLAFNG